MRYNVVSRLSCLNSTNDLSATLVRRVWFVLALLSVAVLVGCGGGTGGTSVSSGGPQGQPSVSLNVPSSGATQLSGHAYNVDTTKIKVVIYVLTNQWYVQPLVDAPFTNINSDGSWTSSTHPWNAIVVLLVDPATYSPAATKITNPALDSGVIAWTQYPSTGQTSLSFSGYTWGVKSTGSSPGDQFDPGPNYWSNDPSVVSVATDGLHLKNTQINGVWQCAEVYLQNSLGYGTYTVQVSSRLDQLDRNTVAAPLFIYASPTQELDNEYSGTGGLVPSPNNAQFVVQPYTVQGNLVRYVQPSTAQFTTQMDWRADHVTFTAWNGWTSNPATGTIIYQWTYTGGNIPTPGQERVHINLWLLNGSAPVSGTGDSMVINSFTYQQASPGIVAAAAPTFNLPPGSYSVSQMVTLSDATPGATIYYTTDGTTPTTASTTYTGAITVNSTETIQAIATANGYSTSAVATAAYTITQAAAPAFSVAPGTYTSAQTVTISDATTGATIYYTTDGTTPTKASTPYTGAITVNSTETIKAIATASGFSTSAMSTATYIIGLPGPQQWAWMGGSSTISCHLCGNPGVYGTLGTASAGNTPGSRDGAVSWTDSSGNLWLFGGEGNDSTGQFGSLNDLWEFNPIARQWAWISGSSTVGTKYAQTGVYGTLGTPSAGNVPGGRLDASSWTDSGSHLWLFGGDGVDSTGTQGFLNDLWEFDPATSEWTWMSGSSTVPVVNSKGTGQPGVYGTLGIPAAANVPGGRIGAIIWTNSDNSLWLFGGEGFDSTGSERALNDLWRFDPATREWTWMGGSSTVVSGNGQPGVYGTLGTPAAGNIPGGRYGATSWTDSSGDLWLFGGSGFDAADTYSYGLNDLWKFNPATLLWTWMGGSSTVGCAGCRPTGNYGTMGSGALANTPGGRGGVASFGLAPASGWTDSSGKLWLFGGSGVDATGTFGWLNDLWNFNPATSEWAWMGGSNSVVAGSGQPGVYGTLDTPAAGNVPGGRGSGNSWSDKNGNFWLFGGRGADSTGAFGFLNDLWEYQVLVP